MASLDQSASSSDSFSEPSIQNINSSLGNIIIYFQNLNFVFLYIDDSFNPLIPQIEEEKPLTIAELKMRYLRESMLCKKSQYCQLKELK